MPTFNNGESGASVRAKINDTIQEVDSVSGDIVGTSGTQTLTNKTVDSASNTVTVDLSEATVTGTLAEFNTALSDATFASLTGTETLTNKTLDANSNIFSNFEHGAEVDDPSSGVHGVTGNVVGTTDTQTLTNKTLTSPDINGGTADDVTIGGTTPADGTFANLTANTSATVNGNITVTGTVDGRDVASDGSKLDGIEAGADVTDTANVTSAGALMDSELTDEAAVKALDQGVATTDSPSFAGLTVDTDTLYVDSANDRVGIGTSSPNTVFHVSAGGAFFQLEDSDTANTGRSITQIANDSGNLRLQTYTGAGSFVANDYLIDRNDSGANTHAWRIGNSEAMRIDSNGNVVIGATAATSSQEGTTAPLSVSNPSGDNPFVIANTGGDSILSLRHEGQGFWEQRFDRVSGDLRFVNNSNERMRIDSSGNVGIGTSSPTFTVGGGLEISKSVGAVLRLTDPDNTGSFDLQKSGNEAYVYQRANASIIFGTNSSEAMRIDSSGNLLVGTTTYVGNSSTDTGGGFGIDSTGTYLFSTRDGETTAFFNRLTSDGDIAVFRKDGSTVGSIGVDGVNFYVDSAESNAGGIQLRSTDVLPRRNGALFDNGNDLGDASYRWDDVYATNGTIQTSDRNEKQDIEALSDAEQRVAVAAKRLLRKYRWKSAVEEKGDEARIHFGIIAQDLQAAFEAEGLDAGRYGMFISSTWWEAEETYTDDDGVEQTRTATYDTAEEAPDGAVERTRFGVRYPELLAFIIAAI